MIERVPVGAIVVGRQRRSPSPTTACCCAALPTARPAARSSRACRRAARVSRAASAGQGRAARRGAAAPARPRRARDARPAGTRRRAAHPARSCASATAGRLHAKWIAASRVLQRPGRARPPPTSTCASPSVRRPGGLTVAAGRHAGRAAGRRLDRDVQPPAGDRSARSGRDRAAHRADAGDAAGCAPCSPSRHPSRSSRPLRFSSRRPPSPAPLRRPDLRLDLRTRL